MLRLTGKPQHFPLVLNMSLVFKTQQRSSDIVYLDLSFNKSPLEYSVVLTAGTFEFNNLLPVAFLALITGSGPGFALISICSVRFIKKVRLERASVTIPCLMIFEIGRTMDI